MLSYLHRIFIGLDQFLNVLLNGNPDETISSRLNRYRMRGSRLATAACWVLDRIDRDHCTEAVDRDIP